MSTIPVIDPAAPSAASFFAKAKKAFAGGATAAVAAGAAAVVATVTSGGFTSATLWTVLGAVAVGFVGGFSAVYVPKNAS